MVLKVETLMRGLHPLQEEVPVTCTCNYHDLDHVCTFQHIKATPEEFKKLEHEPLKDWGVFTEYLSLIRLFAYDTKFYPSLAIVT